jgi:hypothetical protein
VIAQKKFMVIRSMFVVLLLGFACFSRGQDIASLLERAPGITACLHKAIDGTPPFHATAELRLSTRADPEPTIASGRLEYQDGNIRWQFDIGKIESPHLTPNAAALLRRVNGERLLVLTRPDLQANYLVLHGQKAYLEQPMLPARMVGEKRTSVAEMVNGRSLARERFSLRMSDGTTNHVSVWRTSEGKRMPAQIQVAQGEDTFNLSFREVRPIGAIAGRFQVPPGFASYETFEDLAQSILVEKMRKTLGF